MASAADPASIAQSSSGASLPLDPLSFRSHHLPSNLRLSYVSSPLLLISGSGSVLTAADSACYLDMYNNVAHLGHSHPSVTAAAASQLAQLNTNTRYLSHSLTSYVRELLSLFPGELNLNSGAKCFLVNSGSEANDLALRIAREYSGHSGMLSLEHGYHGHTVGCIGVSQYKFAGKGGKGMPKHVRIMETPDIYRGKPGDPSSADALISELHSSEYGFAGFISESILSCGGQLVLPPGFLSRVYSIVHSHGGVCIADEVQTGLGRLGSHVWAFEAHKVTPDIVTLGKPMGNGFPLAAVVCSRKIIQPFESSGMEYFNTFGGSNLSCAVGLSVIDTWKREKLMENAAERGNQIIAGLQEIQKRFPIIGDVRGSGLFLGVELVKSRDGKEPDTEAAQWIANEIKHINREREAAADSPLTGVLLSTDGPHENVLKIKPPMCITADQVNFFLRVFEFTIKKWHDQRRSKL